METGIKTEFNVGDVVIAQHVPFSEWAETQEVTLLEKHAYNNSGELDHPWRYVADFKHPSGSTERLNFYKALDPKPAFAEAVAETPVPDFNEYITMEEDGSAKILLTLNPAAITSDPKDALVYKKGKQADVVVRWKDRYRPKTVGKLVMNYLESERSRADLHERLDQLNMFFAEMNDTINQYADQNDLCDEFEKSVDSINEIIERMMPWCNFRFTGRTSEYEVTVSRQRTIVEQITVTIERNSQMDDYDFDQAAIIAAQESWSSEWEETDGEYSTDDYEVTDTEKRIN